MKDRGKGSYRTALDCVSKRLCNLKDGICCDTGNHILAVWHRNCGLASLCLDANEAASGELVNLRASLRIEVQGDAKTLIACFITVTKDRCVVTTDLCAARALRGRAVEVLEDESLDGVDTVVDANGEDIDAESVFLRRAEAELGRGSKYERADVHCCTSLERRHVRGIEGDGGVDGFDEDILWDLGDGDKVCRVLHAEGVFGGTEDLDGVAWGAEGFEALISLLAVVEAGSHAMDAEEGVGDEFWGRPLSCLLGVVAFDVAVYFADFEADVVPVCRRTGSVNCSERGNGGGWRGNVGVGRVLEKK